MSELEKNPKPQGKVSKTTEGSNPAVTQKGITIIIGGKSIQSNPNCTGIVYLLIDCSSSMAGDKLNQAKKGAADFAVSALLKKYQLGIIKFESHAKMVCEMTNSLAEIKRHLVTLDIGGDTNMTDAIYLATKSLAFTLGKRVMVIVTDGKPDNPVITLQAADQAKERSIDIIAIGTDDADQGFLAKLASKKDLGIKVKKEDLSKAIAQTSQLLALPKKQP